MGFPKMGVPFRPHNKDYAILGSIFGSPYIGKLPYSLRKQGPKSSQNLLGGSWAIKWVVGQCAMSSKYFTCHDSHPPYSPRLKAETMQGSETKEAQV